MTPSPSTAATKPVNPTLSDWLAKQYDQPQYIHCGPEALAWDNHGLQQAQTRRPGLK